MHFFMLRSVAANKTALRYNITGSWVAQLDVVSVCSMKLKGVVRERLMVILHSFTLMVDQHLENHSLVTSGLRRRGVTGH